MPQRINLWHSAAAQARPARSYSAPSGVPARGNVFHHPTYAKAYAVGKLQKLGVTRIPKPIRNREHILDTDRAHSVIAFPRQGLNGRAITAQAIGAHHWNDPAVRAHMGLVMDAGRLKVFAGLNLSENEAGRYYWHHDAGGFDYSHYRDKWGYHWYGWYTGDHYFWTRYYANRFWFYDDSLDRWCFWNNGFWWWQDPYHVGNLYMYDNDEYVPSNDNEQVVSTVEPANPTTFRSPDDSRVVKVMGDSKDAFLYDTAIPPSFSPLYLASKVTNVQFSDTSKGQPLEVTLTLSNGSMESFDSQGGAIDFDDGQPSSQQPSGNPDDDSEPLVVPQAPN
jgi:hypothetical protein